MMVIDLLIYMQFTALVFTASRPGSCKHRAGEDESEPNLFHVRALQHQLDLTRDEGEKVRNGAKSRDELISC